MTSKIIDLSIPISNDIISDPPSMIPKIYYTNHKESFGVFEPFFPGLKISDLPDSEAGSIEKIELTTHNGTHLDAPYHFHSTMDKGKPSLTIDEIPLDWCFRPGVKLDFRHFSDGYLVTPNDVQNELDRINYSIKPFDIILVNTSAGKAYGSDKYLNSGCGFSKKTTLFLLDQGVKISGTDAWSWDAPFALTAKKYAETKDASLIWEGHKAGREKGYCHLEKLHNLEQLPPFGFMVACFPVKIARASAGWTRAVAIIN